MNAEVAIEHVRLSRRWLLVLSLTAHALAIAAVTAAYDPVVRLRAPAVTPRATTVYLWPTHPPRPRYAPRRVCGGPPPLPHNVDPDPPWPFAPLDCDRAAFVFLPCD